MHPFMGLCKQSLCTVEIGEEGKTNFMEVFEDYDRRMLCYFHRSICSLPKTFYEV